MGGGEDPLTLREWKGGWPPNAKSRFFLHARSASYLQKRVIFRNTPGPARPAAYYGVCITRRRFSKKTEIPFVT